MYSSLCCLVFCLTQVQATPNQQKLLMDLKPHPEDAGRELIRTIPFEKSGTLKEYLGSFPKQFGETLLRLPNHAHVIDAGAGQAYFAEQYVSLKADDDPTLLLDQELMPIFRSILEKPRYQRAFVTAIDLDVTRKPIPTYGGKLKVLTGRFFEDIPNGEIGGADLILDRLGVLAYSPRIDDVLRKYTELLKDDGALYIHLGMDGPSNYSKASRIRTKLGIQTTLLNWIMNLHGLRSSLKKSGPKMAHLALELRISDRSRIRIPQLKLLEVKQVGSGPAIRMYQEQ